MITPAFGLTATERVLPSLMLDFSTGVAPAQITTTRAGNTATQINSSGNIELVNADTPRLDYDPITKVCKGLLIENARTNLLRNSLVDGTNLNTQSVTTADIGTQNYILSFYGTGTIVVSGAVSQTLNGSGAYPIRTFLRFTVPPLSTVTLTVSGTVQYAQFELVEFPFTALYPTSFIPTDSTVKTRALDDVRVNTLTPWFNSVQGTLFAAASSYNSASTGNARAICDLGSGVGANRLILRYGNTTTSPNFRAVLGNTSIMDANGTAGTVAINTFYKMALGYKSTDSAGYLSGTQVATSATAYSSFVPTALYLGTGNTSVPLDGHIQQIRYYSQRLTNAELAAITT
jgi:hypothetical protein